MLLAALLLACTCRETPPEQGRWYESRGRTDADDQAAFLQALGYADGTIEATGHGVGIHDPTRAWQGLNLYVSGHGAEATLLDMDGAVVHQWRHDAARTWPPDEGKPAAVGSHYIRRARALPDGDLLVIHQSRGIARLGLDSTVEWAVHNGAHHDLQVDERGHVWVLTRVAHNVEEIDPDHWVVEDFVEELDADGTQLRRHSVLMGLARSPFAAVLDDRIEGHPDILHTNSLELLPEAPPGLEGTEGPLVLLSLRNLDALAVLDAATGRVVWAGRGPWKGQHDARWAGAGRVLLFDNRGGPEGRSRALALTVPGFDVSWSLTHAPADVALHSDTLGAIAPLPNGNVLITESEQGRAIEVVPESGDIVWSFTNPHSAGSEGQFIAALFELERLPPGFAEGW